MPKIPSIVALALAFAALPAAAASAAPTVESRLSLPKGDASFAQLTLRASCSEACVLRLTELNVLPYQVRGGVQQLPNSARGPLRISRTLPARKQAAIRVPVPYDVRTAVSSALPRGAVLRGNVVMSVAPAGGGEPIEAVRQFSVSPTGTRTPFPSSPYNDSFTLPLRAARRAPRTARYSMTIAGWQTARWSYDRSEGTGSCRVVAKGSGTQQLTFRSDGATQVEQVIWRTGERALKQVGVNYTGVFVPITIDAVRDSSEEKSSEGCGDENGGGGGGGGGGAPECTRRGTARAELVVGLLGRLVGRRSAFSVASSILNWREQTTLPDCPNERAASLRDALDVLRTRAIDDEDLTRGGNPGKVIMVVRGRDVTPLGGGSVTTTVRIVVTFRKLG